MDAREHRGVDVAIGLSHAARPVAPRGDGHDRSEAPRRDLTSEGLVGQA